MYLNGNMEAINKTRTHHAVFDTLVHVGAISFPAECKSAIKVTG